MDKLLQNLYLLRLAYSLATLIISLAAGFCLRWVYQYLLPVLFKKMEWKGEEIFLHTVRPWIIPLALLPGLSLACKFLAIPGSLTGFTDHILIALAILFCTIPLANLASRLVHFYFDRIPAAIPFSGLTRNLVRVSILVIGIITMLSQVGVSIAPLITVLAIGGLALALALRETLADLFAGLSLTLGGQIRIGDRIKLQSGEEGQVVDTDWRSTRIRSDQNHLIIIPHSKMAEAIITKILPPQS